MEEYQGAVRLRLTGQEAVEAEAAGPKAHRPGTADRPAPDRRQAGRPSRPSPTSRQLPRDAAGFVKRRQATSSTSSSITPACGPRWAPTGWRRRNGRAGPASSASISSPVMAQIQQTNPIDEAVTRDQAWIYNGINIYVAGNFDETVPTDAQLDALAQLCAWLLSQHNLPETPSRASANSSSPARRACNGYKASGGRTCCWNGCGPSRSGRPCRPSCPATTRNSPALRTQVDQLQAQVSDLQSSLEQSEAQRGAVAGPGRGAAKSQAGGAGAQAGPHRHRAATAAHGRQPEERPVEQIKFVVFNHTAVDASIALERIAAAHQKRWGASSTSSSSRPMATSSRPTRWTKSSI